MRLLKRALIFVHRWLGVALCLLFLLWFPSGIVMMYWSFPEVSSRDRLERAPALDPSAIKLTPGEAFAKLNADPPPTDARLDTFDGRPIYEFRNDGDEITLFADTGEEPEEIGPALMRRVASRWSGQPAAEARVEAITQIDQWTIANFRSVAPVTRYTWPDGQQVYVSANTGDVVQATTRASRVWAYLGAIPHWLYFPPLRKHGPAWSRTVIWSSAVGTASALLGLVIAAWMLSPSKRYRYDGAPTAIPYRGQKRLHTILGLVFGIGAVTWAFSGMLSMEPFPLSRGGGAESPSLPQLRGEIRFADFAGHDLRDVLARLPAGQVKSLEFTSFDGTPMYLATLGDGATRVVPLQGSAQREFDRDRIMAMVRGQGGKFPPTEVRVIDQYDRYYLDRRRRLSLPVILARYADAQQTRIYIDPKTARIASGYQSGDWMDRWLYHGLHSLNFPWLYNHRPLWDIVVISFMIGGTTLCVTSLILAWRVLGRKLRALLPAGAGAPVLSEDLAP